MDARGQLRGVPAPKVLSAAKGPGGGAFGASKLWTLSNKFVSPTGLIQAEVPIGPGGAPRRLVLKVQGNEARSLSMVLSGSYYGQAG